MKVSVYCRLFAVIIIAYSRMLLTWIAIIVAIDAVGSSISLVIICRQREREQERERKRDHIMKFLLICPSNND